MIRRALLLVCATLVGPAAANAQQHFDVAAHVAVVRSSEFDDTDTGVGGRLAWHPVALVGAEAEMTFYPWKDTKEKIPLAVRHVRTFLKANRPD